MRRLVKSGRVLREGRGGAGNPFTYRMSENFSQPEEPCNSSASPPQNAIIIQRRSAGISERSSSAANSNRPAPHASSSLVKHSKKAPLPSLSVRPTPRSSMTLRVRRQNVSYAKFDQSDDESEYDRQANYDHDASGNDDDDDDNEEEKRDATAFSSRTKKQVRARTASVDTEPSEIDPPESHDHDDGSAMIDRRGSDGYTNTAFVERVHIHRVHGEHDDCEDDRSCSTLSHQGGDDCYALSENEDMSGQDTPQEDDIDVESLDLTVVGRSYGIVVASLEEAYCMGNPTPASDALVDSFLA